MATHTPKDKPLITCIMPTADRGHHVANAVQFFLDQDYPERELIIVDDGREPVDATIADDPRIRTIRLEDKTSIGEKRNLACQAAAGEWIAHWDDDDWHAPWRLSYQARQITDGEWDVCGLARLTFFDADQEKAWEYIYPDGGRPWVAGGTLFYRKEFWQDHRFQPIDEGEDALFVWNHPEPRIKVLSDARFYVALVHAGNTSPKQTGGDRWHKVASQPVRQLVGPHWPQTRMEKPAGETVRPASGPPKQHPDLVMASIPYFGCRAYLRRAVDSILAQSHRELLLVVINDADDAPWDELADIQDERLIRLDLATNRGRYFADAIALEAAAMIGASYLLIQDADDWSEPDRLAILLHRLKAEDAGGAVSSNWVHHIGSKPSTADSIEYGDGLPANLGSVFKHHINHYGLFRLDALQALGGYYAGFRVGYDTLLISLLLMTTNLAHVKRPLYHRTLRPDSLTTAPETGFRSELRRNTAAALTEMYAEAYLLYGRRNEGKSSSAAMCREIRAMVIRRVEAGEHASLRTEAEHLTAAIQGDIPRELTVISKGLELDDSRLEWSAWTLSKDSMRAVMDRLEVLRPKRIIETGSGLSSLFLADYCRRYGAELVSLEHDPGHYRRTQDLLAVFNLSRWVDLRLAPLRSLSCPDGMDYPWYDCRLSDAIDFVLVDGPPMSHGRQAVYFALHPHLAPTWELWLDDANRKHEQSCLRLWQAHDPNLSPQIDPGGKNAL